jgi:hypothetical protein
MMELGDGCGDGGNSYNLFKRKYTTNLPPYTIIFIDPNDMSMR